MEQQEQSNEVQLPVTPEATSAALAVCYAVDAEFRAAFDKDPKAAIAKVGGQELPSDVEIVVHRNEDNCWHIALPAEETEGALSDEDIANVSGGTSNPIQFAASYLMRAHGLDPVLTPDGGVRVRTRGEVYGEGFCQIHGINPDSAYRP